MTVWQKTIGLGLMCSLVSTGGCAQRVDPRFDPGNSSVQCSTDCVAVTKGFLLEHAALFEELIRTKAALKLCVEKH